MEPNNEELESFRRKWLAEVSSRNRRASQPTVEIHFGGESGRKPPPPLHEAADGEDEEDLEDQAAAAGSSGDLVSNELIDGVQALNVAPAGDDTFRKEPVDDPKSALEHFEKAVIKEAQGSLGDSLSLYRRAYRLDDKVDQAYRKKHFSSITVPLPKEDLSGSPAAPSGLTPNVKSTEERQLPTPELIASFANLPIPPADPIIENTPSPPCPIASIPSEVLVEIMSHVASLDPALFARLALVCKRFAYGVAREQRIWKAICRGHKFGFASMHYTFACDVKGHPLYTLSPQPNLTPFDSSTSQIPKPLTSWAHVFQAFPRIRFTGIYISTVNYTRPGANSALQSVSWNTPIHIVTYYRYLRFYPDGSLISLLSTTEPVDVVPHISWENLEALASTAQHQRRHQRHVSDAISPPSAPAPPIPAVASGALKNAHRGRWHLIPPFAVDKPDDESSTEDTHPPAPRARQAALSEGAPDPRDLLIETEGANSKYTYSMHLSLRSTASGGMATRSGTPHELGITNTPKNTKLAWRGFWSYNHLTDDWAEFQLRNDRAFVFRRVRGWGMA